MTQESVTQENPPTAASTIVVAEPDILVRMVIAAYLRHCGYRVIEAVSADEVMSVLTSDVTVEVVFAEIRGLGATDGFALARHLREAYPHIDVILTSGVVASADKAAELCDDGVLKKPYQPEEVVRRINVFRERRRSSKPG